MGRENSEKNATILVGRYVRSEGIFFFLREFVTHAHGLVPCRRAADVTTVATLICNNASHGAEAKAEVSTIRAPPLHAATPNLVVAAGELERRFDPSVQHTGIQLLLARC